MKAATWKCWKKSLTKLNLWCLVPCLHKKHPFCISIYLQHISVCHTLNICSWDPPGDPPWSIYPEWCPDSPVLSIVTGSAHLLHFQLDNHSWNVCTNQYRTIKYIFSNSLIHIRLWCKGIINNSIQHEDICRKHTQIPKMSVHIKNIMHYL